MSPDITAKEKSLDLKLLIEHTKVGGKFEKIMAKTPPFIESQDPLRDQENVFP